LIEAGDRVTGLSLGDPDFTPLKLFLQKHAKAYQHQSLARTYGTFLDDKIIGYITLVCGEVVIGADDPSLIDDPEVAYKFPHYPAVKIARLAVDKRHRKKGIGPTLVDLALGTARDVICPAVGCRFVMVDSKAKSVAFYLKHGFTMLDTVANKSRAEPVMFVDLHKTA
jgi:GNAT superfamily N-acetyltransferase